MTRYRSPSIPLPRSQQERQDTSLRASVADLLDQLFTTRAERDQAYREVSQLQRRLDVARLERDRLSRALVKARQQQTKRRSSKAAVGQMGLWD